MNKTSIKRNSEVLQEETRKMFKLYISISKLQQLEDMITSANKEIDIYRLFILKTFSIDFLDNK